MASAGAQMSIFDLPIELLQLLPQFLRDIEDFMNLSSTCRTFRTVFSDTHPNTILRLADAASRIFFRPDPYFLIAATAHQVSEWGLLCEENARILQTTFQHGVRALHDLCIEKAGLTMEDIRGLHAMRFTIINPTADMIDRAAGVQWYQQEDFWNGGASDAYTIHAEPVRALFQIIIYGELFGSGIRKYLDPNSNHPCHSLDTRLDYIKYCIPDVACWHNARDDPYHPQVLPTGPYAPRNLPNWLRRQYDVRIEDPNQSGPQPPLYWVCGQENPQIVPDSEWPASGWPAQMPRPGEEHNEYFADQEALQHIITSRRWREAWRKVRRHIGPDFEDKWRHELWGSVVQLYGLAGLEMLTPEGLERWRSELQEIRDQISELREDQKAKSRRFRINTRMVETTEAPCLLAEIAVCKGPWFRDWDEQD